MQKFLSKYALAAHLALMATAPLLLLPLAGTTMTAVVSLWLALFGFIWVLMEPSRRHGEMPHNARARVASHVQHDPLFWFSLVLVGYAGIRALNGGVGLAYDAELMQWSLRAPSVAYLPGGVDGSGTLSFVLMVSLAVLFMACRHALGRSARAAFLAFMSFFSACASLILCYGVTVHHPSVEALVALGSGLSPDFGTAFGLMLLIGTVALYGAVTNKWLKAEPLIVLSLMANAIGVVLFAPLHVMAAFLVGFLLLVVVAFVLHRNDFEGSGSFRCALALLMTLAAPVLYLNVMADTPFIAEKLAGVRALSLFPEGYFATRDALSAIALKTWKTHPWIGSGLDSFGFDIRFIAKDADWAVISARQATAVNGWWQLLVERGVVGAMMLAVALGMLLWTYVARCVVGWHRVHLAAEHMLGPMALIVLVTVAFFDSAYLRPEVLLLGGALLAFSDGAFPVRTRASKSGKEAD